MGAPSRGSANPVPLGQDFFLSPFSLGDVVILRIFVCFRNVLIFHHKETLGHAASYE
jgi:hypothetical protein